MTTKIGQKTGKSQPNSIARCTPNDDGAGLGRAPYHFVNHVSRRGWLGTGGREEVEGVVVVGNEERDKRNGARHEWSPNGMGADANAFFGGAVGDYLTVLYMY